MFDQNKNWKTKKLKKNEQVKDKYKEKKIEF